MKIEGLGGTVTSTKSSGLSMKRSCFKCSWVRGLKCLCGIVIHLHFNENDCKLTPKLLQVQLLQASASSCCSAILQSLLIMP